jgi:Fic family protein
VPETVRGYAPQLQGAIAGIVSDAEARIVELNASAHPALAPLARLLLKTESIASSKVEGMQVDASQLARAEARRDAGESIGHQSLEILANIDAMQLAVEQASAKEPLAVDHLLDIHRALLIQARPEIAGHIRDSQSWIGGNDYNPCDADFVPPPAEEVARLLDDLVAFCADESLPPLVQAALAHAQFETIHPFDDGNGRAGRALVQVVLRRRRLAPSYVPPISVVLAADRDRYIRGLTAHRQGDEAEWIEVFATAAAQAAALASHYLQEVLALQELWREQLRRSVSPRADAAAWALIDELPAHPVITVPVAVVATGRSKPAISLAVEHLVSAGVLEPLSSARRNRSWEAAGLLDVLSSLESGRMAAKPL